MSNSFIHPKKGYMEVICGCMYSGKTEELIRQIKRCEFAKLNYLVFKPRVDNRYSETDVTSHNRESLHSIVIDSPQEIFQHIQYNTQVIAIDEAQFFSQDIVDVSRKLVENGRRVIVAGLDTDWKGHPFGPMPQLLATAEVVKKQYAICMSCGEPATRTQRMVQNTDEVLVGSDKMYEARCLPCHDPLLTQVGTRQSEQPNQI